MKIKLRLETAIVILITFGIVFIAPIILDLINNNSVKVLIKPLFYIVLVGAPVLTGKILINPFGTLGYKKEELVKQIVAGLIVFIVVSAVLTITVFALGDNKVYLLGSKKNGYSIGLMIYYIIFNTFLCAGIGEETLFRGYLMERFEKITNSGIMAVLLPAILFGIWHFPGGQDFLQVIIAMILGLIWGTAKLKMKNCTTLSVGIAHGLHDLYLLVLTYLLL